MIRRTRKSVRNRVNAAIDRATHQAELARLNRMIVDAEVNALAIWSQPFSCPNPTTLDEAFDAIDAVYDSFALFPETRRAG